MLRRQPGFTLAAVLTLALGIGANTAVFSLVNATLFQRLRVGDPASLAYVSRGNGGVFSYPMYATLRDHNQHFAGLAGWGGISASLNAGDSAELVSGLIVTGNFFDVLDVGPAARGRLLSPADDVTPGAHPVAVISYDFWQTRFAGEADIVGREVRLNGHVFTVVGVAPAGFDGPTIGSGRSLYVPMMMQAIMRPPRARYSGDQNPDLLKHRHQQLDQRGRPAEARRPDRAGASPSWKAWRPSSSARGCPPGRRPRPPRRPGHCSRFRCGAWKRAVTISVGSCDRRRCCSAAWSGRCC